jgi:16S rRNA C967 or C1407 C5-methylase (RsmB/RsmF family)/NOL1/NOP2/fmu family ribosome biogenesis protein
MSFPKPFLDRIHDQISDSDLLIEALNDAPTVSIRYNTNKRSVKSSENAVPWCPTGTYLDVRPNFALDPLWHAGGYYVQEASSMFLDYILSFLKNNSYCLDTCLDFCAAPGGKSTLIMSHLSPSQTLIANEVIDKRNAILRENLTKWGAPNFIVTKSESTHWKSYLHSLDLILVDAPCSGEGMFRKDRNARNEWSEENVAVCESRQKTILEDLWHALKPGGVLIYSTCTFNPGENEIQLSKFAKKHALSSIQLDLPSEWQIVQNETEGLISYQFFPHKSKGEGFFCSILVKEHDDYRVSKPIIMQKHNLLEKSILNHFEAKYHDELASIEVKETVFVTTKNALQKTQELRNQKIFIKQVGIACFEKKKNGFQINHGLSMIYFLNKDYFPSIELTLEESIKYLSKNYFELKDNSNGIYLVKYQNTNLGFVKIIDYRINNYYPTEWRIIKF